MAGGVKLANPAAQWEQMFNMQERLPAVPAKGRDFWYQFLDDLGVDEVLEFIARGNLPNELALANDIPLVFFREWCEKRISRPAWKLAMKSYGEVCVLKAQLALLPTPENAAEAAVQKELAAQYRWTAERADPEQWAPPKGDTKAIPSVTFMFESPKQDVALQAKDVTPQAKALPVEDDEDEVVVPIGKAVVRV